MPTTIYTCPAGHDIHATDSETVECEICNLTATHLNTRTGEVFEWLDSDEFYEANRDLEDQLDAAFDNQYFGGDW